MEVRHLRALLALERHGTLERAAEAELVSPRVLRHHLSRLERELEHGLCTSRPRLAVAAEAEGLVSQAELVLHSFETFMTLAQRIRSGHAGDLGFVVVGTRSCGVLPAAMRWLREWAPEVRVDVRHVRGSAVGGLLDAQRPVVVICPVGSDLGKRDLREGPSICAEESVLIVGRDHPLAEWDEVSACELSRFHVLELPDTDEAGISAVVAQYGVVGVTVRSVAAASAGPGMRIVRCDDLPQRRFAMRWLVHHEQRTALARHALVRAATAHPELGGIRSPTTDAVACGAPADIRAAHDHAPAH